MNAKRYEEYLQLRRLTQELISAYEKLEKETAGLRDNLAEVRWQLEIKNEEVKVLQTKYERAKFSGSILGSGEDAVTARKRVSELVREIDKCIALLDR